MGNQRHHVGFKAHFSMPPYLLETATSLGLEINKVGKDQYKINATSERTLANLSPDFVSGNGNVDLKTLIRFLEFLHQPIRISAGPAKRETVHKFLTLISSGATQVMHNKNHLPGYLEADEHVEVENSIKEKDLWHTGAEIGRATHGFGAVPHSWVDLHTGQFNVQLDRKFVAKNTQVAALIEKHAEVNDGKITVNAKQFQSLCRALASDRSVEQIVRFHDLESETPKNTIVERAPLHKLFASAVLDTSKNFVMDMYSFMRESPAMAATALAVAGALYWANGDSASTTAVAQDMVVLLGEQGPVTAVIDPTSLSEEARNVQSWHYDMGPFGLYKHYMYNNAVIGPTQTLLDGVRIGTHWVYEQIGIPQNFDNHFSEAAEQTVKPVADVLFKVNIFQNFTHAGFWMYMFGKGVNHGFRGAEKIIKLFEPLSDLGHTLYTRSKEALGLQKSSAEHTVEVKLPMSNFRRAWLVATGTAASVSAMCVGMDMAGQSYPLTDAISSLSGHAAATGATGVTFLAYNFVEDILAVHMAGGAVLLTAGSVLHYTWSRAARPVLSTLSERSAGPIELGLRHS